MSERRIVDEVDWSIAVDCPGCGWGMPGPHARGCPVRRAAQRVDRLRLNREATDAVRALVRMLVRHRRSNL